MSMTFSLTGADLAAALRRMAEDAAKRALAKREQDHQNGDQHNKEHRDDQSGQ